MISPVLASVIVYYVVYRFLRFVFLADLLFLKKNTKREISKRK